MFGLISRAVRNGVPSMARAFTIPTRTVNVVKVYKQTPRRIPKGSNPLQIQTEKLFEKYDPDGSKRALFDKTNPMCPRAGDVLRITKKDGSTSVGMLLALNRNHLATSILLRTKITGIGVEQRFHVYNPEITKVELLRVPTMRWPKQKYYFVRGTKKYDAGDLDGFVRRQHNRLKR